MRVPSPRVEFRSDRPGHVPRAVAVTRFPGTRQEEEKQNKPERALAAWTPLKRLSTQHNTYTRSDAEGDSYVDVLKVSGAEFRARSAGAFGRKELALCRRGGGISSEANDSCLGRSLACCCALSLSWDEEGGG